MADIIDFNAHKKQHSAPPQPPEGDDFPAALLEHLNSLPDNAMMDSMGQILNEKLMRLLMMTEIGSSVTEVVNHIGLKPDDFAVNPDSVDRCLATDLDQDDPLWNGPWFDWQDKGRLIRVATTLQPEDEQAGTPGGYLIDVLRLDDGADHWMRLGEQGWINDGPPAEYFDLMDSFDDYFDDDDDDDDDIIEYLELTPSIWAALHENGIETIEQLRQRTDDELLALKGIGKKALQRIRDALEEWDQ